MELLEGETLQARIERRGRLTGAEALPLAIQMAEGLADAHAAGIIHRDFKSGNVIVIAEEHGDRAVVTDFGLARADRKLDAALRLPATRVIRLRHLNCSGEDLGKRWPTWKELSTSLGPKEALAVRLRKLSIDGEKTLQGVAELAYQQSCPEAKAASSRPRLPRK